MKTLPNLFVCLFLTKTGKRRKNAGFNETLNALESGSFNIVGGSISGLDDIFQSNFVYFNVDGMNPPTLAPAGLCKPRNNRYSVELH